MGLAQKNVKIVEMQEEERGGFYIGVEMPQSTTIEEVSRVTSV